MKNDWWKGTTRGWHRYFLNSLTRYGETISSLGFLHRKFHGSRIASTRAAIWRRVIFTGLPALFHGSCTTKKSAISHGRHPRASLRCGTARFKNVPRHWMFFLISLSSTLKMPGVDWPYVFLARSEERRVGKECRW